MEENNSIIWDFGYGSDDDFDRKESVVIKDDFLNTVIWKFNHHTQKISNDYGDKTEIDLYNLYPFAFTVRNGKVQAYIKHIMPLGKCVSDYNCHKLPSQYIEQFGFIDCIPIGIVDREKLLQEWCDYDSITLADIKRCIELTNCSKNILD